MTIRDIAKLAGVSPAAVSIVLNNKKGVSDQTRATIQKIIKDLNYVPVQKVRSRLQTILCLKYVSRGVFVEENEGFISAIVNAMSESCKKNQYKLVMLQIKDRVAAAVNEIDFSEVCGVIVIASELPSSMYEDLRMIPVPFLVVDNMMPGTNYACVGIDNAENVYTALKYCKTCGYHSIGYIKSSYVSENLSARGEAWNKYASLLGFAFEPENVYAVGPTLLESYEDLDRQLKKADRPELPECFFVDNDTIAIGAMRALHDNGYRIPDDVALIGFDDVPFSAVSSPSLTTIHVHRAAIGRQAIRQLLHIIRNPMATPAKTAYAGDLIVRSSMKKQSDF
jgi:LacI family transcriptional regulator